MSDLFDAAAEAAGIPEPQRAEITSRVRAAAQDELTALLAERMHDAIMVDIARSRGTVLAPAGSE